MTRPKPDQPKRDMSERHALPVDDPEAALKALLAVDPDDDPELTEEQIEAAVRAAITDPDPDGPPRN